MINIDGSYGEGGGQIIRTSMSLAAITHKPVSINNIRENRPKPGLQAQHLTACKAVREVCCGRLFGAELRSTQIVFEPGEIQGREYEFHIGTAGSVILVAQSIIPILINAAKESVVRITGGTHVMKSPGYDYFACIFLPAIHQFGALVEARLIKPGFYPKGGGEIELRIKPSQLRGCCDWKTNNKPSAIIRLANLPHHIAEREKNILNYHGIKKIIIKSDSAFSAGNVVTIWQGFKGVNVLGERGKKAELVAQEAVDAFKLEHEAIDKNLADQLLIYAATAEGQTTYPTSVITKHFKTNAYIIKQFIQRDFSFEKGVVSVFCS